jgi:hypothetical protein
MSQLIAKPSLPDRMLRAARLDVSLYNEVEADLNATSQALTVVVLAAVASGIGAALTLGTAGRPNGALAALVGGVIAELVGWAVWSYVMYFVGTRLFHGTATYGELLRTLGFAYVPGLLLILRFIPVLGGLIVVIVGIWRIVTGFIAVREALDLDTGNTIATIVVGIIGYIVVAAIVGLLLAAVGVAGGLASGVL